MINTLLGTVQKTVMAATVIRIAWLGSAAAGLARFSRLPVLRRSEE
jgi:hypothetical protein